MQKVIHILAGNNHLKKKPGLLKLVQEMAKAQSKNGLEVSIWRIGEYEEEDTSASLNSKTFLSSNNRLRLSGSLRAAIDDLPEKTIFHAHDGFVPEHYALSRYLKKIKSAHRLILSPHGSYSEARLRTLSLFHKVYFYFFEQPLIRNASMVHLVGPAEVSGYSFFIDKITPFVSLPNGLSDDGLNEPFNRDHLSSQIFVIACNGPLDVYEKGLDILLKAFATFSREVYSQTELWLVGSGKDEGVLRAMANNLGIYDSVKFYGDVDGKTQKKCLAESHVYVQPSRVDCIPVTALKAAALGVPLIVTEETNLGGYVRQNEAGWFLSRNDVKSLTLALHDAYFTYQTDEEGYQVLSHNAYRMVREELNWNSLARKWVTVYSSLL